MRSLARTICEMKNLTPAQWEQIRLDAVHHIVHDYANLVSSAEMVITGQHLSKVFDPPVNSHIFHAFLLNCRKMTDFFDKRYQEDVIADDYVPGFTFPLTQCEFWRGAVNKQLAHVTYARDENPREITKQASEEMYNELKQTWKKFLGCLVNPFAAKFEQEIRDKLKTEFSGLDLW